MNLPKSIRVGYRDLVVESQRPGDGNYGEALWAVVVEQICPKVPWRHRAEGMDLRNSAQPTTPPAKSVWLVFRKTCCSYWVS